MNSSIIGNGLGSNLSQFNQSHDASTTDTSLYVLDRNNNRVKKLSLNGSNPTAVLSYNQSYKPYYFYVDHDTNIYLSVYNEHKVLLYHSNSTNNTIVAGTGVSGSNNDQLNEPYGIFVNRNGTIYIADFKNHRIMKWMKGTNSGIRVAGDGANGSNLTQLNQPTYVTVDPNEYMYIAESGNHRITRWAPNSTIGVCIAGCTGTSGIASTHLYYPRALAFDSNGSLYVTDGRNHRVQKFQILRNNGEYFTCYCLLSPY